MHKIESKEILLSAHKKSPFFSLAALLFNRWFWVYLMVYLVMFHTLDQNRIKKRVLNYLSAPISYLLQFSYGKADFNERKFHSHLTYYKEFVSYSSKKAEMHGLLGYCYYHLGNIKKAKTFYKKAVEFGPDFFWFPYDLGVIYFKLGDFAEAKIFFEKSLRINPRKTIYIIESSLFFRSFGTSNIDGQFLLDSAQEIYDQRQTNLQEGYRSAFQGIIICYYQLKDYNQMLKYAIRAINFNPDQMYFYYWAGVASYYLGNYEASVGYLQKFIERNPLDKDAYYFLSLNVKELNNPQLAVQFMERSQGLKSEHDFNPPLRIY